MKKAIDIIKSQKPAPHDWNFEKFPDDGENFYSGKFRISGHIIDVWDAEHPLADVHFMISSEPCRRGMHLYKNEFGGLEGKTHAGSGHIRLIHLSNEVETDEEIIDDLCRARDNGEKVIIYGRAIHIDALNPADQIAMFRGWDASTRCPVAELLKIAREPKKPNIFKKIWDEAYFAHTGRYPRRTHP